MSGDIRIAASLWSVEGSALESTAHRMARAGLELWHWDRSDGTIAVPGGFLPDRAAGLAASTGLRSEAHLMVADPTGELDDWLGFCERVIVHAEASDTPGLIDRIRSAGREAAVAVSPGADPVDWAGSGLPVLVMSVVPGEAGTPFRPETVARVAATAATAPQVGVDGGVDAGWAGDCIAAGATWIVSGTAITAADDATAWLRTVGRLDGRGASEADGSHPLR